MRITGGKARGLPIRAPRGLRVRPTSDKVRQALFNTIATVVAERTVLDLFAGTGAFGIEALSRDASHAVFVDNDTRALRMVDNNLIKAGFDRRAEIIRGDFRFVIETLSKEHREFDLIFIDPPYESDYLNQAASALDRHHIVAQNAIIIAEHFKKLEPPASISGLPLARTRPYGQTALSYYQAPLK